MIGGSQPLVAAVNASKYFAVRLAPHVVAGVLNGAGTVTICGGGTTASAL